VNWPKKPTQWIENRTLFISIPFTWNLPEVKREIMQRSFEWDTVTVGGPALNLMPQYFKDLNFVTAKEYYPGAMQRVNPQATKTTTGCNRTCEHCSVPKAEGELKELSDWPDRPIICDNNLLAASREHVDRVIDRLIKHGWADFNQGLDTRLLTKHHANRLAEIKKPRIRLALDSWEYVNEFERAYRKIRAAGIVKRAISCYALIGYDAGPEEAWERCKYIESYGIRSLPQWFHRLDALEKNTVTPDQEKLGWTDYERRKIMQWFYQHKKAVR
jgi:hypothetical protein